MAKLPRDLSHDRLIRFLARHGWKPVREGGRHTILGKAGEHLSVPRHSRLKTGTVARILKQAGVSVEDAAKGL